MNEEIYLELLDVGFYDIDPNEPTEIDTEVTPEPQDDTPHSVFECADIEKIVDDYKESKQKYLEMMNKHQQNKKDR
ncbi:hypothetical protein GR140_19140 [Pseudomonas putida]|uniref:hypothetical protein n=1 Tax=Pseudomonas putida TaxID=303 RepID=UPI001BAF1313|nr:hypothetical protein [Pseudomonas putida]QUG90782.1 hypothetical protein GR140_19140 [Pseudomonas putida]